MKSENEVPPSTAQKQQREDEPLYDIYETTEHVREIGERIWEHQWAIDTSFSLFL